MMRETTALLDAFEEALRRALPFDSGPIEDTEIGTASTTMFALLEDEDAKPAAK